ncbi:MAG: RCC1 domain-containing protein [Peptococcaceae bacterium]|nr:RCC1 domain-containing protein [Peptococcaceae bacterium]
MDLYKYKHIIAAGRRHTVGLKSDGMVTAVGDNKCGQCDVSSWRDVVAVHLHKIIYIPGYLP